MKIGALLLLMGLIVMGAEVWMAVTMPEYGILSAALFALSAFTWYTVFTEWWRYDVTHARKVYAWRRRVKASSRGMGRRHG